MAPLVVCVFAYQKSQVDDRDAKLRVNDTEAHEKQREFDDNFHFVSMSVIHFTRALITHFEIRRPIASQPFHRWKATCLP